MTLISLLALLLVSAVALLAAHDLLQKKHSLLRNFPILGRARFMLEKIGPELRQYIVASNNEERPFSREQRTYVYASSKELLVGTYTGFGTDKDLEASPGHVIITHSAQPLPAIAHGESHLPAGKVLGAAHGRAHAFRPNSAVNISAMSFGALSGAAVQALNKGAAQAGCLHNTGEGGLSDHHKQGGDLIFQVGTGYFSVRDKDGRFDLSRLTDLCAANPVKMIEIKLSQGAKPGLGGTLPGSKVTPEIAKIRGIEVGKDCISPSGHTAFHDAASLIEWCEQIGQSTGLPVGIKTAVGQPGFMGELLAKMAKTGGGPDFITVDGGEGGTGAAPLAFADHVSLPLKLALSRTYALMAKNGLQEDIGLIASGKLGFPDAAAFAFALGADQIAIAREAMLAIGCIQAQKCHTGKCPTGVTAQSPWLTRGLDPTDKGVRAGHYIQNLRHELLMLSHACGVEHPALIGPDLIEILEGPYSSRTAREVFSYKAGWGLPSAQRTKELQDLMNTAGLALS